MSRRNKEQTDEIEMSEENIKKQTMQKRRRLEKVQSRQKRYY